MLDDNNQQVIQTAQQSVQTELDKFEKGQPIPSPSDNKQQTNNQQQATQQQPPAKVNGEADKKNIVDLSQYDKLLNTTATIPPLVKKDDKQVQQQTTQQDNQQQQQTNSRNFEGFSEQEAKMLGRMSNEAFDFFSKLLKDSKVNKGKFDEELTNYKTRIAKLEEGKQILPDSYYDNPNGYMLSPEFHSMQRNVSLAQAVQNHWQEQLNNVVEGKAWQDLENDPKTGELVLGEVHEVDADNAEKYKIELMKQLNGSQLQVRDLTNNLQQFVGGFQTLHKTNVEKISNVESSLGKIFEDKESNEAKFLETAAKPLVKSWGIRSDNPAFNIVAQQVAIISILREALESLGKNQQTQQTIVKDQKQAGPTNSNFSGGAVKSGRLEPPTLDDFNRILAGRSPI